MINRREFTRLTAAASMLAALPPALRSQGSPRKIRYGIVGLGRISLDHFMPGTRMGTQGEITALVSGHPDKAAKTAAQYGIPAASIYTYETFDTIKNNPNVDAVYIALPNSMHAEYTIRAANAGKHVLCEKPMANSVAECDAMIAACKKNNRKLMIAYRLQREATTLHAQQLVRSGALGKIQAIESCNGFNIQPGEWRLSGKLAGGGPLMDVGIYSLNACRFLLGEEPVKIAAYSSVIDHDGRFNEVEENVGWTMEFPSGAVASCTTTYGASMDGFIKLHGSKGTLTVNGFGYQDIKLEARMNGKAPVMDVEQDKDPSQFTVESDYFSRCILDNTDVIPSGEEGRKDVDIMMKIYAAAGRKA